MKRYRILKEFKGSQDGRFTQTFKVDDEVELSDYLVSCVPPGSIEPVEEEKPAAKKGSKK